MGWPYTFTVFTPTYNRAHTIHRVYESLCAQTFRDFEWLVIDDGSTDDTRSLIERWQGKAKFPIRYIWQENGGKHTADNRALGEARGRFLVTVGSDDECAPTALERLLYHWESIPSLDRSQFAFVNGLASDTQGRVIGDRFPSDTFDTFPLELVYRYRVRGDKFGLVVTEIARKFPFPELPGRSAHIPEGVVWMRIGRLYKVRCVNEVFLVVHHEADSLSRPSGTRLERAQRSASGLSLYFAMVLNDQMDYFVVAPKQFVASAVRYVRFSLHCGIPVASQWSRLTNWRARGLYVAAFPLGYAVYLRDRRQGS